MPSRSSSASATYGSVAKPFSSISMQTREEYPQSNTTYSPPTHTSLSTASSSIPKTTMTFSFSKDSNIPYHRDYAINRFHYDVERSHPAYQYYVSEESMLAYTARAKSILDDFDATYYKE